MKNKKENIIDTNSSVFVASFSHYQDGKRMPRNGMIEPLLSFFLPKVKNVLLLDQPHQISDVINPIVEIYNSGKLKKKFDISSFFYFPIYLLCKIPSKKRTRISYKLRDFFSVFYVALSQKKNYDLFIGLEGINALAGIVLRRLGNVKKVIYYVSDYSPKRFGKAWFNDLYLRLDRFCVKHADFTWDVSSAMRDARLEAGISQEDMKRVLHVPNGLFRTQIISLPIARRNKNSLVYMGSLDHEFGVDLAIEALKIIKEKIPEVKLHVVGGGEDLQRLKKMVEKLNMEDSVIFYGFVVDNNKMAKIVRSCCIGLAPYRAMEGYSKWYGWYGDAGKIRQYLASGLPVITTQVPPLGRIVAEKGAAILTNDTIKDFSESIMKLLGDDKLYRQMTEKAKSFSKENTWENSYLQALKRME